MQEIETIGRVKFGDWNEKLISNWICYTEYILIYQVEINIFFTNLKFALSRATVHGYNPQKRSQRLISVLVLCTQVNMMFVMLL